MRVAEEPMWLEFTRVYRESDDGRYILQMTCTWADDVEDLLTRNEKVIDSTQKVTFREAFEHGYLKARVLEEGTDDVLPVKASSDVVAEALFLLSQVWEHSEEMIGCLTPIETCMLETVFSEKIWQLQDAAKQGADT